MGKNVLNSVLLLKKLLFTLFLTVCSFGMWAATITSTTTGGTWSSGSTWVGGVVPSSGDAVIIATTGTNSVNISGTVTQTAAGSVTVNSGSLLRMSRGTMTFGALTVASGGTITIRRSTTILGATNITGRINFGSTSGTARTMNFNGTITLNAGAVWDETNVATNTVANTYVIKNNFINNATTFTPLTGSAHNFTGTGALSGSTTTTMPRATFTGTYTNNGKLTSATLLTVTTVTLTNNGTITATTSLAGSGGVLQGAAGILNIGGTSAITTLNATTSGNTVNYTGAAQTIHTGNYSNLNFSGSGAKTLSTGTTSIGSLSLSGTATSTTVVNLTITNNLTVNSGTTFTTGNNFTMSVGGTTSVTGSLVLGGTAAKTFTGDVIINGVWNEAALATINFGGNFTNNATTFTANTGGHNFTGATKIISGTTATAIPTATFTGAYTINSIFTSATLLTVTGVSVTNNSTVTATTSLTGTGTLIQGAAGILNIGNTIGITTLNASTSGNTVNYTGAGQTGYVTTYSNLTLSGSGTKTFATSPTINAVLSMEGTAVVTVTSGVISYGTSATLQYNTANSRTASSEEWITPFVASGGIIIKNTGAITTPGVVQIGNNTNVPLNINSGATLTPGANLITLHGDFINNGTITSGSGGITIGGTTATQSIDDFTTTGTVTLTKTAGVATISGNMNGGPLTINGLGGTLNLGIGYTHTFTGIVTLTSGTLNGGSSTLNENAVSAAAWNGTPSVFVASAGTVNFGGAGAQTIAANSTFNNLGFSGSGIKTLSSATTINNNFSISGTAVVNLGTGLTHTALSLTLGGVSQVIGTWGSTASTALNKNATWFGSTATGTINVSCVAPSAPTSGGNKTICSGAAIPALTVTVSAGQTVDWYNQASGGALLLSGAISYTPTGGGNFYAETRVIATGCLSATRTLVSLTINSNPTVPIVTGSTICASPGNNGTISTITSQTGVNYQLYNSGNAMVQAAKPGTGSALNWSALAAGNGYYVIATNAASGCFSTSITVNVATNPNPTALVLTGSTICATPGDDGTITSSTSQIGVNYQLYDSGNVAIQAIEPGTGGAIPWTDLGAGSGYYVIGTNSVTGCVSPNSNAVNIVTTANPVALVLTGSTICASPGDNGTITSTTSVFGIEYQLIDDADNDIGTPLIGTGSGLTFTDVPAGTGYYVEGINLLTGCAAASSNLVDVLTNPNPANKTITVSSASVCTGTGANIIVAGSLASEDYQLRNDLGDVNIGTALTGNGSNLNLPSGNLTATTTFNVLAKITATGCTTELTTTPTITVNPNNTAGAASSSPTLCVNTALTAITHATTGATGIGTATGLPTGVTAVWASNTITISGTPTASGTFNYSIPLTGGCGNINATGTITVNSSSAAPTGITGTTTICNGNSTTLTVSGGTIGAGAAVQWFTGSCGGTSAGTGNSITVSPSSNTTYYVRYSGTCNTTTCASRLVTVNTPSAAPTGITGTTTICNGSSTTLTVSGGTIGTGVTVQWFTGSCGGTSAGTGNSITVSPSSNTTYYVRYSGTCNTTSCASQLVTVTTPSVAPTGITGTTTICNGNSTTLTVNGGTIGTGATVQWFTGSCGGTSAGTGNSITVSPSSNTTYYVRYSGTCNTTSCASQLVTVNATTTAATITGTAAICLGSSINLQATITGGTSPYTLVYNNGVSNSTVNGYTSGSNISVAPTATTTYTLVSVTSANGCVGTGNSGSAVVSIDLTVSTNGGPWSNGVPAAGKSVIYDGTTVTLGTDLTACSLTLKNNSAVTIPSGSDVTLSGAIAVETGSTFTLNNNANLIQSIPANTSYTNSGNIVVKRNSSALKRLDYTLWSSPVTGQGLYAFSPSTFGNRFYVYRTATNVYNNPDIGFSLTGLDPNGVNGTDSNHVQFAQAKGYLIRMPWDHPTAATVWNGTFTGVPNNGNITYTMANNGAGARYNLVGNPYPSPISMTQFVSDNSAKITGTLYFWRETNGTTTNNAYCSWAGGTFTTNSEAQVFNPNGIVRTGQGFFVEALNAATTVDFKNGQRSSDNGNQFFKTTNDASNDVAETNRFWLNITNASGAFSQMAAGYMTNATDGVDLYDGKNINTGSVLLNSILDNTDYTIQGKSLPFNASDVIPLSYKITTAGSYTIAIDHVDGLFTGGSQAIYLKDNLVSAEHNLQTGAYTFASDAGTFNNRFEIVYQSQLANPSFTANTVVIYNQNDEFVIDSGTTIMNSVKVFDIRGRLLQEKSNINANQTNITCGLANEVLLIQITSEDGTMVTKKVIR